MQEYIYKKNKQRSTLLILYMAHLAVFEVYYISHLVSAFTYIYLMFQFIMVFAFIFILPRKIRINKFDIIIILFCSIEFLATIKNGLSIVPLVRNILQFLVLILGLKWGMYNNMKLYIQSISNILSVLTITNTICAVIFYPSALYYDNVGSPLFLIGGDNTSVRLYILAVMFSVLKEQRKRINSICTIVSMYIFVFIRDIGTGKICVVVMTIGIFFYLIVKLDMPKAIIKLCIIIHIAFFILVVIGNKMQIFSFIIQNFLKRDLTLTTRTIIWDITIEKILEKPVLGNGFVDGNQFESMLPHIIGVNAHNTYLMITFIGGVALLSVFLYMFWMAHLKYDKQKHNRVMAIIPISLFLLMLRAQVEGADTIWLIYLLYYIYFYKYTENLYNDCGE